MRTKAITYRLESEAAKLRLVMILSLLLLILFVWTVNASGLRPALASEAEIPGFVPAHPETLGCVPETPAPEMQVALIDVSG